MTSRICVELTSNDVLRDKVDMALLLKSIDELIDGEGSGISGNGLCFAKQSVFRIELECRRVIGPNITTGSSSILSKTLDTSSR